MSDNIVKKIIAHSQQVINKMMKPPTENLSTNEINTENNIIKQIIGHSQNVLNKFIGKPNQNNIDFVLKKGLVAGRNYFQIIGLFEEKTDDGYLKFNDNGLITTYLETSPEVAFIQEYTSTQIYEPSQENKTNEIDNNTQYLGGDTNKENVLSSIIRHSQSIIHKLINAKSENNSDLETPLISPSSMEDGEDTTQTAFAASDKAVSLNKNIIQDVLLNSHNIISKLLNNTTKAYNSFGNVAVGEVAETDGVTLVKPSGRFQKGILYKYYVGKYIQEESNKLQFVRDDTAPLELVAPANTRFQEITYGKPVNPQETQPIYPEASAPQYIESPPNQPTPVQPVLHNYQLPPPEEQAVSQDVQLPPIVPQASVKNTAIDTEERDDRNYYDRPIQNAKQITIKSIDGDGVKQNRAYTVTLNSDKTYQVVS
jgi:hypothetical protein